MANGARRERSAHEANKVFKALRAHQGHREYRGPGSGGIIRAMSVSADHNSDLEFQYIVSPGEGR